MTVRVIYKSKVGECVEFQNIDNIDETNSMIVLQYKLKGQELIHPILKQRIKHIKVIPGKEE